jgi:hypothetical protein
MGMTSLPLTPREELMWLVALLDGEGCFTLNGRYPNIVVSMTDEDSVRLAHQRAGCGSVTGPYQPKNPKHKPFWRWKVAFHPHVFALCKLVAPYMSARRQVAIDTLLAKEPHESVAPLWERVAHWEQG